MAYTTINKSTDYFNTKLYTGNAGTQSITGVGFQPDFTWIKSRSGVGSHNLFDAVRGVQKRIFADLTSAEQTSATYLNAFGSDGFTLGNNGDVNGNSQTTVAWNWKAGTTGSGTTGQGKTYNYSVNTAAGFSIMTYQGSGVTNHKIPHHLGAKPTVKFVKSTGHIENWTCYWDAFQDSSKYIQLNTNNAKQNDSGKWGGYDTSSLMNLGSDDDTNEASSGVNFVAYCFAEKKGYSKFGSYTGNGNADGTFVYTGFKPAFVMLKLSSAANENWAMYDNKRNPFNSTTSQRIRANTNAAEGASNSEVNLLSNGFKVHDSDAEVNSSGQTYIYMAFGQSIVGTNGVTAKAR